MEKAKKKCQKKVRLGRSFYRQPTLEVARQLLGASLVRVMADGSERRGKIVEVEAYIGPEDKASHASFGRTKRCEPMYGRPGIAYVYFIYGMYWMFNLVTEKKGKPCAVLIRALEPLGENLEALEVKGLRSLASGPAKLCRWLEIDGRFNGEDLVVSQRLWVEKREMAIKPSQIVAAKRIGVDYAGVWKDKKWRFYLRDNPYVSKK